jgi:hypothetical protein
MQRYRSLGREDTPHVDRPKPVTVLDAHIRHEGQQFEVQRS